MPIRSIMTGKLEEIELSESLSSAHGMEHSPKRGTQFSPMSPFRMNSPALLSMKSGRSSKDKRFFDGHAALKSIAIGSPTPS